MMPHEIRGLLTTNQLAAFLCVSASAVRHMAREHGIEPVEKVGKENAYQAREFVTKVGPHDRTYGKKRRVRAKLTSEGGDNSAPAA